MGTATAMAARMKPNNTVRSRLLQQQQQQPRLQHVPMAAPAAYTGSDSMTPIGFTFFFKLKEWPRDFFHWDRGQSNAAEKTVEI